MRLLYTSNLSFTRLSSPDVCYNQASFVLQLIKMSPVDKQITYAPLFRRLYNFLDTNAQKIIIQDFLSAPSNNEQPRLLLLQLLGQYFC